MALQIKTYYRLRRIVDYKDGSKGIEDMGKWMSVEDCIEKGINCPDAKKEDRISTGEVSYEIYEIPPEAELVKEISAEEVRRIRKGKNATEESQTEDEE